MQKIDFVKLDIPFTQVANGVLYDKNLSLGAKALYAYMYSKPNGWQFSADRIGKELEVSKPTILKHLQELKNFKYLLSQKLSNGRMSYKIIFPPMDLEPKSTKFALGIENTEPESKKATVKKSHGEESLPISNKDNTSNKDIYNNKENTAETSSADVPLIIKEFESINPAVKRMYGNKTQRQACEDLINTYGLERILSIISKTLPKTNQIQYFPVILTPLQLRDKFSALESAIQKFKNEKTEKESKHKVAFY